MRDESNGFLSLFLVLPLQANKAKRRGSVSAVPMPAVQTALVPAAMPAVLAAFEVTPALVGSPSLSSSVRVHVLVDQERNFQ